MGPNPELNPIPQPQTEATQASILLTTEGQTLDFANAETVGLHEWFIGKPYKKPYINYHNLPLIENEELDKLVKRINAEVGKNLGDDIFLRDLFFWDSTKYKFSNAPKTWIDSMVKIDPHGRSTVSRTLGPIIRIYRNTEGRLEVNTLGDLRTTDIEVLAQAPYVTYRAALVAQYMFRPNTGDSDA